MPVTLENLARKVRSRAYVMSCNRCVRVCVCWGWGGSRCGWVGVLEAGSSGLWVGRVGGWGVQGREGGGNTAVKIIARLLPLWMEILQWAGTQGMCGAGMRGKCVRKRCR